ncbi:hypothetical protein NIES4102_20410 [Chondrocystis sp. NIES-4102]|nr:hypothetical protein NIES4102_20410 [Chondrocystis sp. NIES-4102]
MGRRDKALSKQEKFFKIVFNDLMILPAYKLQNNQRRAFEDYTDPKFKQSRQKVTVRESDLVSNNQDTIIKDTDIDLNPNELTIIGFCLQLFFDNSNREIIITIISLLMSFLVRAENLYLKLLGIFFLLLFYYFALVIFIKFYRYYLYIQSTFHHINRLYRDINLYSSDLGNITEYNLEKKSCKIIKNII